MLLYRDKLLSLLICCVFFVSGCSDDDARNTEQLKKSNTLNGLYVSQAKKYTMVVIPDTQRYVSESVYDSKEPKPKKAMYSSQIDWIIQNKEQLNIVFVSHVGDVVDYIENKGDWQFAHNEQKKLLDAQIPNAISPGNTDVHSAFYKNGYNYFSEYFPESMYAEYDWYGDDFENKNWNSYQFFEIETMEFMVINLQWGIRDRKDVRKWAAKLLEQYPNKRAIVVTHAVMANDQESVWNDVVKNHDNVFLFIGGHDCNDVVLKHPINNFGHPVEHVMVNFQCDAYGGNGKLGYFSFIPADSRVNFTVYNPWERTFVNKWDFNFLYDMK